MRAIIGGIIGGTVMWIVGFIFWGTPLKLLAVKQLGDANSARIHSFLAEALGPTGTGAYPIPWDGTQLGTQLHAQGPVATILFNSNGFAIPDTSSMISGLILALLCGVLVAFALRLTAYSLDFVGRLKVIALIAIAITTYSELSQPIYFHMPSSYFIFSWIASLASWLAAGAVIAKLLPTYVAPVIVADPIAPEPVTDTYDQPLQ